MAKTKHGLPQTRGFFQIKGLATGLQRDGALKTHTYDSGSTKKTLNFGLKTNEDSTVYVQVEGYKNKDVYLFKQSETKGQAGEQKVVPWDKKYDYEDQGFNVIGVKVGLEKDENGKNIINNLIDFDAAEEISNALKDDTSIFVRGDLDYSSFTNDQGEVKRSKKFLVKNLYLAKDIDFEAEDYKEISDFKQKIIFTGIQKSDDKGETKFVVEAKIVTRNSIEDTEFIVYNTALANQFRKSLKPFTAIDIWGNIVNKVDADDVQESKAVWGETDSFKRVNNNYIRELVITGADPESIDTETFTEENIQNAIQKLKSEGQVNKTKKEEGSWGDATESVEISDDDLPW
ncbi:hypothetical protein [Heyndrickxia camelliae]|uniref:Single-stranded DNA-binding protein n=1 Tax=Heyndrickxia camelliae TaxID=1707093 RepID=A0A2N3LFX3_9BACI|nr:hypothetical protein [Heyndrickxia camelliae]PKR83521.1 hypothetical protein CWO92_18320 [Heyndrickxia camelliae]